MSPLRGRVHAMPQDLKPRKVPDDRPELIVGLVASIGTDLDGLPEAAYGCSGIGDGSPESLSQP